MKSFIFSLLVVFIPMGLFIGYGIYQNTTRIPCETNQVLISAKNGTFCVDGEATKYAE